MAIEQGIGAHRHQRADAARNRQRLLQVASEVFRERGLEASVGDIAERAGVGRATLFRNFPSKQDLIVAVVIERIEEGLAEGEARLVAAGDEELLFPFLKELIGRQQIDRALFESVGEETFLTDESMHRAHAAIIDLLDRLIAHDQKVGYVREGLGAVDVLMLSKGACTVATAMAELGPQGLERHLSLIRGAIAAPGRQGNIQRITQPCPGAALGRSTRPGIEGELVRAEKQYAGVIFEGVLGAIAMMHVPIHDQDPLQAIAFLGVTRGNGDVIEQAEPHGTLALSVMPRRP